MSGRTILFTGGGTAGHVTPNLPLMSALAEEGWQIHYAGSAAGIERELALAAGAEYHVLPVGKLRRYLSVENLLDVFRVVAGILAGWRLCRRLRPALVFSKGGFVSVPAVLGARLAGIPVIAHESDRTPGLATRLVASSARVVCTNFPETEVPRARRRVHTGTPLRDGFLDGDAARGLAAAGFDATDPRPLLFVVGGSLGSSYLNALVREALPALLERFRIVHVCGRGHLAPEHAQPGYVQYEFVAGPYADLLAAADLVISRAGANALMELLAARKVTLLVPLSTAASRGDQIDNAGWARDRGLARMALESELDAAGLVAALTALDAAALELRAAMAELRMPAARTLLLDLIRSEARSS